MEDVRRSSTSLLIARRIADRTCAWHRCGDLLTVRALQYGLDPNAPVRCVARELAAQARGDRRPLQRALNRIDRGLEERSTPVGQRARTVLEAALAIVAADSELPLGDPGPPTPT
jgi:hypothetical protein